MTLSDLIIIGAGPGGYELAADAAAGGLDVVLFEKNLLGGTCLNCGCIPTKALCRSAQVAEDVKHAELFGINIEGFRYNYASAAERKNSVVSQLRQGVEMAVGKCKVVRAEAAFETSNTIIAGGETYSAPKIVIATGSVPASLPIPGADLALDSSRFLELTELPDSIIIIGGGVIGIEFASILNSFGVDVTVMEYCKEILPPFDRDIAKRLRTAMQRRGVKFLTSAAATAIEPGYIVSYEAKGKSGYVKADMVLMAVGRRPLIPDGAVQAGIEVTHRGITVDSDMHTTVSGVYAIGDVNGLCMLAHAASAQGRIILGEKVNLNVIPAAVFSVPECAMVGKTEEQLKEEGIPFRSAKSLFRANGKAVAMAEDDGMVKLIISPESGIILGCHIIGPHAADLVQEIATIMNVGLPVTSVAESIHAHPTLSEAVWMAARQLC